MKTSFLLCALALGAPVWAQTTAPVAPVKAPQVAPQLVQHWEFTPDFLRDRSRIVWRLGPEFEGDLLETYTTGAGTTTGETITFPDQNGKTLAVLTATFDKNGKLQKQELRDASGKILQSQTEFPTLGPISVPGSVLSLQTRVSQGVLEDRTFSLGFANVPIVLVCRYDPRGRRTYDYFSNESTIAEVQPQSQTVIYNYNARGLEKIEITRANARTLSVQRDAKGKMIGTRALSNGLLTSFAAPLRDAKGNTIGTRIESYRGGILAEITEDYLEGNAPLDPNRPRETFSERTFTEGGKRTTEQKFEFSISSGKTRPPDTRARIRKRTVYAGALPGYEEISRDGVLVQRSDFGANGVISKLTRFNPDGSVASAIDATQMPYADGTAGIIRR